MKIETHEFEIVGISPLLTNNPASMGNDFRPPPGETPEQREQRYEREADESAYRNPEGRFFLPSVAFRAALLSGAKGKRFGKVSAPALLASTVFSTEPRQPILCDPKTWKPLGKREKLVTSCVPPKQGRVVRSRALFPCWGLRVRFDILVDRCDPKGVVEDLLNNGGMVAGVGAWRIEKKGEYGRFEAKWLGKI